MTDAAHLLDRIRAARARAEEHEYELALTWLDTAAGMAGYAPNTAEAYLRRAKKLLAQRQLETL